MAAVRFEEVRSTLDDAIAQLPRVVTKYCSNDVRAHLERGEFKIGLLSGYRDQEDSNGMMSDLDDGRLTSKVRGDVRGFKGNIEGYEFSEMNIHGPRFPVVVHRDIEANAFCVARKAYDDATHREIVFGNATYTGNEEYTSFVELNLQQLIQGLALAMAESYNSVIEVKVANVAYGERSRVLNPNCMASELSQERMEAEKLRTIFTKPVQFAVEKELRLVFARENDGNPWRDVWTRDCSPRVRALLCGAILQASSRRISF